jgi:hypothetical protein
MKSNTYNDNYSQPVCQVLNLSKQADVNSWAQRVQKLANALCEGDRELFYREYSEMSRTVATRILSNWGWRGDIYQDAQDVASECTLALLKQESRSAGVFKQEKRTHAHLCGYLSQTIWQSCKQRIMQLQREMKAPVVSLEALMEENGFDLRELRDNCLSTPDKRLALKEAIEKMQQDRRSYPKLPKGITPMDCVLDEAVAKAVLQETVPTRTLERYRKQIRETIALEMDIDLDRRRRLTRRWAPKPSRNKGRDSVGGLQKLAI